MFVETAEPCGCRRVSAKALVRSYRVERMTKAAAPERTLTELYRLNIARNLVRSRRNLMIEGTRSLTPILMAFFERKLEQLCAKVEGRARSAGAGIPQTKSSIDVGFGSHEEVWRQALEEVLGAQANVELIEEFTPPVQSIIAKSYERTTLFIGEEKAPDASVQILRRAQDMAQLVTRINETTRTQVQRILSEAIERGDTIGETIQAMRDQIPEIARTRVPTIVRNETGMAIDHGTKQAFKESAVVATVDVIGCTAVEPGIPTFDGRPTCNITGVPAHRVDELNFHVNHTGALVAGTFHE